MPRKPVQKACPKYTIHKYTVIRIENIIEYEKLFECIPDRWFVDENKTSCYWPPSSGKSFTVRAINCEKPDDTWSIYECTVVSEGHLTYQSGFKIVQEKCNQKYNTSSADEHITAAAYKREHPVLAMQQNDGNIEYIFAEPSKSSKKKSQGKQKNIKTSTDSSINLSNAELTECTATDAAKSTPRESVLFGDESELACRNGDNSALSSPCNITSDIEITVTNATTVHPSVPPASNRVRSSGYQSDRSISNESRRSNATSRKSRSRSRPCVSRSNMSRSSRSSLSGSRKSSKRSHSSRSTSNASGRSRSRRKNYRSNGCSTNSSRSCSVQSTRSVAQHRSSRGPNNKRNVNRDDTGSNSEVSATYMAGSNNRGKESARRNTKKVESTTKIQLSKSYSSRLSHSMERSRSRSTSNESPVSSPSHLRTRIHHSVNTQKINKKQESSRVRRTKTNTDESFVGGRNKKRRYFSSTESVTHSKYPRINVPHSQSTGTRQFSSRSSRSPQHSYSNSSRHVCDVITSHRPQNTQSSPNNLTADISVRDLMTVVKKMNEIIEQSHQQLKDYDRRLHRMEVTVNKILVLVGDLNGNGGLLHDDLLNEQGFEIPDLPITSIGELISMKRKLKNKEFRVFLLQHERDFCCPTKNSSDTATMSKYLKRFISLRVRSKLTLKESEEGETLYTDFHQVYLFLVDVMRAGYKSAKKSISSSDAHTALRVVWGRSKQQYRESQTKRR